MSLITIIGRGHSGTRAMSHTLSQSGVYMGAKLNESGDLVPAKEMYEACRIMAGHVRHLGGLRWDFEALHTMPIDPAFTRLVESYLSSVFASDAQHRGWKLPETILIFPWIARLFPEIRYIYWVRDPRDCIAGDHITDDMSRFGVPWDTTDDLQLSRATSWKSGSTAGWAGRSPSVAVVQGRSAEGPTRRSSSTAARSGSSRDARCHST